MKKTNISIICILFILFLYSCGSFSDGVKVLKNEKIRTTDEFLVKKREPLALPPDYKDLPKPGSNNAGTQDNKSDIGNILKIPKKKTTNNTSSSAEQSIINQIRK